MSQAAKRCFEKAQELERSFQTPEGSNTALCWFNAEGGKKKRSLMLVLCSGISCHRDSYQLSIHSDCTAS